MPAQSRSWTINVPMARTQSRLAKGRRTDMMLRLEPSVEGHPMMLAWVMVCPSSSRPFQPFPAINFRRYTPTEHAMRQKE